MNEFSEKLKEKSGVKCFKITALIFRTSMHFEHTPVVKMCYVFHWKSLKSFQILGVYIVKPLIY